MLVPQGSMPRRNNEVLRDVEKRYSAVKEGAWISSVASTKATQMQRSSSLVMLLSGKLTTNNFGAVDK